MPYALPGGWFWPHTFGKGTRQYGAAPLITPVAAESNGRCMPRGAERYAPNSPYTRSFHIVYAVSPATCCASVPSMSVAAPGVGATAELPYGKPQAGVLFQTSCTVGLLFTLRPKVARLERMLPWVAKRKSALSTPI